MSKKDYEKAAAYVRKLRNLGAVLSAEHAQDAFLALFDGEPRFDRARFIDAASRPASK